MPWSSCKGLNVQSGAVVARSCRRISLLLAVTVASVLGEDSAGDVSARMAALVAAYPEQVARYEAGMLVWRDGMRMAVGEPRPQLSYRQRIATATLWDQVSQRYFVGWPYEKPKRDFDPGRLRCESFFAKVYGDCAADVEHKLVRVKWPPAGPHAVVTFSSVNGAAAALEAVGNDLSLLPREVQRYAARPDGTYVWRQVAGGEQRSAHSYGIAIDFRLPVDVPAYWRWTMPSEDGAIEYPNSIVEDDSMRQVVEAFERRGFVWGGKWYHFDLMHFEFRPELVPPAN